jgi:DNA-binding NarL/FixJ family response regulator
MMRPRNQPETNTLRIIIADDHDLIRRGLIQMLAVRHGWIVCAETRNGLEAVERAQTLKPDIAILDLAMPELDGLSAAGRIREESPTTEILILSMYYSDQLLRDIMRAGIKGYVVKNDSDRDLIAAVQALEQHQPFFTTRAVEILKSLERRIAGTACNNPQEHLTSREREIVGLIAKGERTKDIALLLKISENTVNTHRNNIGRKLDIHSMSGLVLYALRNKIIILEIR